MCGYLKTPPPKDRKNKTKKKKKKKKKLLNIFDMVLNFAFIFCAIHVPKFYTLNFFQFQR